MKKENVWNTILETYKINDAIRTLTEAPIAPQDAGLAGELEPILKELNSVMEKLFLLPINTDKLWKSFQSFDNGYVKFLSDLDQIGFSSVTPEPAQFRAQKNNNRQNGYDSIYNGMVGPDIKLK